MSIGLEVCIWNQSEEMNCNCKLASLLIFGAALLTPVCFILFYYKNYLGVSRGVLFNAYVLSLKTALLAHLTYHLWKICL